MTHQVTIEKSHNLDKSRRLYEAAVEHITGGVHSNFRYQEPHPRYYVRAKGAYVWDVDGNRYIDSLCNMGACILGHGHPSVVRAVREQLSTGLTVGLESELSIETAKLLKSMIPSAESVKFANTGTEAMMHAIHIARGYTGKNRIAKLEGGYNGWYDYVLISTHPKLEEAGPASNPVPVRGANGLSQDATNTVIVPFNNIEDTTRILRANKNELAALIVEPVMFNVGCVTPRNNYLKAVRELTEKLGILLIFDEVISGFRVAPGGAQEYYHVTPDLSTFAKAMANGFPISAVVGKHEFMNVTNPQKGEFLSMRSGVSFFGTYNANQMSLAAANASLTELKTGKVQKRLHAGTKWLAKEVGEISSDLRMDARLVGLGGKYQVYFTREEPIDFRTAVQSDQRKYSVFRQSMLDSGVLMHPLATTHHGLTWAHNTGVLHEIRTAMEKGLKRAKQS